MHATSRFVDVGALVPTGNVASNLDHRVEQLLVGIVLVGEFLEHEAPLDEAGGRVLAPPEARAGEVRDARLHGRLTCFMQGHGA